MLLPAFWCLCTAVGKSSTPSSEQRSFRASFHHSKIKQCTKYLQYNIARVDVLHTFSTASNEKEISSKLCSLSIVPTEPIHWKLHATVKHRGYSLLWDVVPQIWATALQQISASAKTNTCWSQWDQVSPHHTGYTSCAGSFWQFMFPLNC